MKKPQKCTSCTEEPTIPLNNQDEIFFNEQFSEPVEDRWIKVKDIKDLPAKLSNAPEKSGVLIITKDGIRPVIFSLKLDNEKSMQKGIEFLNKLK